MLRPRLRRWFPRSLRSGPTSPIRRTPPLSVTQLEDRVTPASFAVTNLNDSGAGSLRLAIADANASAGADTITFSVAGTIAPASALPTLTGGGTTIDGTTAPGYSGAPVVTIQGPTGTSGLRLNSANNVVRGLQVVGYTSLAGIEVFGAAATGNVIEGNYIGHNGTAAVRNVYGVYVYSGASGTRIGTNADGVNDAAERNVISGNSSAGVELAGGSTNTTVRGNYIGTTPGGTAAIANFVGIEFNGSSFNTIGGTAAGAGNVISGNTNDGVRIVNSNDNVVQGNRIGTTAAGTAGLGNGIGSNGFGNGIEVTFSSRNQIGGTAAGAGNVVSANGGDGVLIQADSSNPNVNKAELNVVQGNRIGTDATGMVGLGNDGYGVTIWPGSNNTIGGSAAGAGNIIAANRLSGVFVTGVPTTVLAVGNVVQGNLIGVAADGTTALGNREHGITVGYTSNTTIRGNTIANNGTASNSSSGIGVAVSNSATTGAAVLGNAIHSNLNIGIDLGGNGVTSNDTGDGDAGVNGLQNYPVITSGASSGGTTTIGGTLNSTANATFTLEFFASAARDPSLFGEGERFLGSATVTTNGSGNATFTAVLSATVAAGQWLTATATSAANNTSEFSQAFKINQPPDAVDDAVTVTEDSFLNFFATTNDTDPDGDPKTVVAVTNGANGTTLINANQTIKYTPNANFAGTDSFTYTISDGRGGTDTATVTVTVTPANDAPLFDPIANQAVGEDPGPQAVTITGVGPGGGADEAGQTVTFTATSSNPALVPNPTVTGSGPTRTLTYQPAFNASGTATITVTANDGQSSPNTLTRTFTITVTAVNDPPVFDPVADRSVNEEAAVQAVTITGVGPGGGADEGGQTVTFTATSSDPAVIPNPTVSGTGTTRTLTYQPVANANGIVTITVTANDGQAANNTFTRTFTVTVNPVNDTPSFTRGANQTVVEDAGAQSVANWATAISAGPANEAGQALQFQVTGNTNAALFSAQPAVAADGTLTYTPAPDANGSATITVRLMDNGGTASGGQDASAAQTFTVTVTAVNDRPVARDDTATTNEDAAVTVSVLANDSPGSATATDEAGQTLVVVAVTQPAHGTVTINANNTVTYTPAADYNGPDSFTYTIRDSGSPPEEATASGTITINPVNDRPSAAGTTVTTPEDGGGVTIDLRDLAGDVETGDADLAYAIVTGPASGTLAATATNGVYTYTPAANFNGTVGFTYTVTDTGDPAGAGSGALTSAAAGVAVVVTPVNDAPAAGADSYSTNEDTVLTVTAPGVLGNDADVDGDLLHAVLVAGPSHGVLGLNADGSFTYTPAANYFGGDAFTYSADDGTADSSPVTVAINVNSVNDAPAAAADGATTDEDTAVTVAVLANDSDVEGDTLTVAGVTQGAHGGVTINGDNTVAYTPAANYFGSDTFTYTITDGHGGNATATVTVMIQPANDAPGAAADGATTDEDTAVTVAVLANDSDVDGDALSVSSVTQGAHGGVTINGDGTVTYTPDANYDGSDSFSYTISDGHGGTATATASITVNSVNDAPVVNAGTDLATNEGTDISFAGDFNDDSGGTPTIAWNFGDGATATGTLSPSHTYADDGTYTVTLTVTDSDGAAASDTLIVTVANVAPGAAFTNDGPANEGGTATVSFASSPNLVTYQFTGQVFDQTQISGGLTPPLDGSIILGTPITGTFTYDPTAAPLSTTSNTAHYVGGTLQATVGNYTLTSGFRIEIWNDLFGLDVFEIVTDHTEVFTNGATAYGQGSANGDAFWRILLRDNDGTVFSSLALPSTLPSLSELELDFIGLHPGFSTDHYTNMTLSVDSLTQAGGGPIDPSTTDTAAGFTYSYDFDNDGTFEITASTSANATVPAGFLADGPGDRIVRGRIQDKDGGFTDHLTTIYINNVAPVVSAGSDAAINEGGTFSGAGSFTDPGTDTWTATVDYGDGSGEQTLALNAKTFALSHVYANGGTFTVAVRVTDDGGTHEDTLLVAVNAAPVAVGDAASTDEDTTLTLSQAAVKGNDTDADNTNPQLTVTAVFGATNGSVTLNGDGTISFTPDANFNGTAGFTYTVSDGRLTDDGHVTVTVAAVNDAPAALNGTRTTAEDTPATGTLAAPDIDSASLTYSIVTGPAHGTVTVTNAGTGAYTYTPAANYNGPDSFTFRANDGQANSNTATVAITVTAVNDAPVAQNGTLTTTEDTAATGVLAENRGPLARVPSIPLSGPAAS